MNRGITKENLLLILPPALSQDKSIMALAEADAEVLAARLAEIDRVRVISNIDGLDESVLDILARDFKVDWWDANYSIEEKRRTLKDSWRVHKTLGTKAAVERAISAVYPNTKVTEWFEYGGRPYGFKISLNLTGTEWTEDRPRRVLERVNYYKSLRSHLDEMEYIREAKEPAVLHMGGAMASITRIPIPELADTFNFEDTLHAGGLAAAVHRIPVPEEADTFSFDDTLHTGGVAAAVHRIPVPEKADSFQFEDAVRIGGQAASSVHTIPIPEDTGATLTRTGRVGVRGAVSVTIPLPEIP